MEVRGGLLVGLAAPILLRFQPISVRLARITGPLGAFLCISLVGSLMALYPVLTILLVDEQVSRRRWVGALLALIAMALIAIWRRA